MNILASVANAAEVSVHDLTLTTPAAWLFYTVIGVLISVIAWFIVRDRNSIADALRGLTKEFKEFRKELSDNYATKGELKDVWLEVKEVHKRIDHCRDRITQRHAIEDGEA